MNIKGNKFWGLYICIKILNKKRDFIMEILNYKISYEYGSDLYTVTAKTNNGKNFYLYIFRKSYF